MKLKVVLKKRNQGGFKATVPELRGCFSIAMNADEALEDIEAKVLLHLGIEKVIEEKSSGCSTHRRGQFMTLTISQEEKFAAVVTLTGLVLMVVAMWGAGIFV